MKKLIALFLLSLNAYAATEGYVDLGSAVVYGGPGVIANGLGIQFGNATNPIDFLTGGVDPSAIATNGGAGSIYCSSSTASCYSKTDNGTTTSWVNITAAGSAVAAASSDLVPNVLVKHDSRGIFKGAVPVYVGTDPGSPQAEDAWILHQTSHIYSGTQGWGAMAGSFVLQMYTNKPSVTTDLSVPVTFHMTADAAGTVTIVVVPGVSFIINVGDGSTCQDVINAWTSYYVAPNNGSTYVSATPLTLSDPTDSTFVLTGLSDQDMSVSDVAPSVSDSVTYKVENAAAGGLVSSLNFESTSDNYVFSQNSFNIMGQNNVVGASYSGNLGGSNNRVFSQNSLSLVGNGNRFNDLTGQNYLTIFNNNVFSGSNNALMVAIGLNNVDNAGGGSFFHYLTSSNSVINTSGSAYIFHKGNQLTFTGNGADNITQEGQGHSITGNGMVNITQRGVNHVMVGGSEDLIVQEGQGNSYTSTSGGFDVLQSGANLVINGSSPDHVRQTGVGNSIVADSVNTVAQSGQNNSVTATGAFVLSQDGQANLVAGTAPFGVFQQGGGNVSNGVSQTSVRQYGQSNSIVGDSNNNIFQVGESHTVTTNGNSHLYMFGAGNTGGVGGGGSYQFLVGNAISANGVSISAFGISHNINGNANFVNGTNNTIDSASNNFMTGSDLYTNAGSSALIGTALHNEGGSGFLQGNENSNFGTFGQAGGHGALSLVRAQRSFATNYFQTRGDAQETKLTHMLNAVGGGTQEIFVGDGSTPFTPPVNSAEACTVEFTMLTSVAGTNLSATFNRRYLAKSDASGNVTIVNQVTPSADIGDAAALIEFSPTIDNAGGAPGYVRYQAVDTGTNTAQWIANTTCNQTIFP